MAATEADALWKLAEKPGERPWLHFVKEATITPLTVEQLGNRAEPVWIAAVGFDPGKRRRAEELLIERLDGVDVSRRERLHLAIAALTLGDLDQAVSKLMADILVEWTASKSISVQQMGVTKWLVESTQRLEPGEAAGILTRAMEKATNAYDSLTLAESLAAVLDRMAPADAARVSGQAANILTQALEKAANDQQRCLLSQSLAAVASRLEPAKASRVTGQAATILAQALEKETHADRSWLSQGLAAVVDRMAPADAARVAGQAANILTAALEKATNNNDRYWLSQSLAAVASRMEPAKAVRVAGQAANILTAALEKATNANEQNLLYNGLVAVASRMAPADAARVAGILTQALEKTTNSNVRSLLSQSLAAVVDRMEPAGAARVARQAATILSQAIEKEMNAYAIVGLADCLAAVIGRMEPADAARVSGQITSIFTQAFEKAKNGIERSWLSRGLATVADRMAPAEAARVTRQVATILIRAQDGSYPRELSDLLAALARSLSRAEAIRVCHPVVHELLQSAETETEEKQQHISAIVVAPLLSALDNRDASRVSAKLAFVICSGGEANASLDMYRSVNGIDCLNALLPDSSRSEVSRRTLALTTTVGFASAMPYQILPALPASSEPLPCRLTTQDLVELLKMPTCFGEVRKVVLKHLGNRYGRTFANHWEFVRFAQGQHLDLDLLSPPKRHKR
jgi:hypothetical protein